MWDKKNTIIEFLILFYVMMLGVTIIGLGISAIPDGGLLIIPFLVLIFLAFIVIPFPYLIRAGKQLPQHLKQIFKRFKEILGWREPDGDENHISKLTTLFKSYIKDFYSKTSYSSDLEGNKTSIQTIINQNLYDTLNVHRDRLEKNGVSLEFGIKRKKYGDSPSVVYDEQTLGTSKNYAVYEEIYSSRIYKSGDKKLKKISNKEIAHYTIVNEKNLQKDKIVNCPNCGSKTSVSGLIDGCDYCGASFRVNDLKERFTSFNFRKDYNTKFKKYDTNEMRIIAIIVFWFIYNSIVITYLMSKYLIDASIAEGENIILSLLSLFWVLSISLGFVYIVTPLIAYIVYKVYRMFLKKARRILFSRHAIEKRVLRDRKSKIKIRSKDKNFNLDLFFSEAHAKINIYYMSDKISNIDGITDFDLTKDFQIDQSIIDVIIDDMNVINYEVLGDDQFIDLQVTAHLLKKKKKSIKKQNISKLFRFRKKFDYEKTEIFFEIKCPSCGASMSTLDGKNCPYCNSKIDISKYEWIITYVL